MTEVRTQRLELHDRRANLCARRHVLVIDDDPLFGAVLSSKLREYGVDALYAPDGVQGYQVARKEKPDAIICDYFMLNGDALYVLCRLQSTPATSSIPMIIMTGKRLDVATMRYLTREICGRFGVVRVIPKSSDIDELFSALRQSWATRRSPAVVKAQGACGPNGLIR